MHVAPGTRFGPYEVTAVLGTGGMGEVYRARDARLDRDVALKVLPAALTQDPDRLARFRREAQVLASLNHPNIAAIYGLEETRAADSTRSADALVLELVEGPTLAERIAAGPLPLEEAKEIAIQIAAALETAHERGIVHRDLKPANVKVRPDGTVKVLDFGLAKALQPVSGQHDIASSPTFTSPAMTAGDVILGTAAYMSPEQARGAHMDRRTDVWAFGCVLFEMLAGRHVFGEVSTVSDAIAAVLKSEPAWDALPPDTPSHIRALLKRCLEKDPRRRLRDIGDAGLLLGEDDGPAEKFPPVSQRAAIHPRVARRAAWAAAAVALLILAGSIGWAARNLRSPATSAPVPLRLAVALVSPLMPANVHSPLAISPNGTRIAYIGRDSNSSSLYLQDLVNGEFKRLPESDGADAPAFSPDGRSIGFTAGPTIKVLPLDGLPRDVATVERTSAFDWEWSGQDHILVAGQKGLLRFPVAGGAPEVIASLGAGEVGFSSVAPLPGGGYVVAVRASTGMDDVSRVAVVVPGDANRLVIAERGASPVFVPTEKSDVGHIVYGLGGRLMAVPFDARQRVVLGGAVPVVENVAMRPNGDWAEYRVAANGTLIFREATLHELVWVDRASQAVTPASANLRRFALPRLSPDGRRVAMEIQDSPHQIWMLDMERDLLTPLTSERGGAHNFAWSPDGSAIVYALGNVKPAQLGWIRTDGSHSSARIDIPGGAGSMVDHWTRDNRLLLTALQSTPLMTTLSLLPGSPPKAAATPMKISAGTPGSLSSDGAWVAYCDCWDPSRRTPNVFIRRLQSGTEVQVSVQGGTEPAWAPNGRELFFRNGSKMMAVPVTFEGASAKIGRAQTLFEGEYLEWSSANYDVTRDGKQFLMVRANSSHLRSLAVRLNWPAELAKLAPVSR